jgi:hypothetical protein
MLEITCLKQRLLCLDENPQRLADDERVEMCRFKSVTQNQKLSFQGTEISRSVHAINVGVCICACVNERPTWKEKVKFDLSSSPLLRPALSSCFIAVTAIIVLNCSTANVNRKCSDPRERTSRCRFARVVAAKRHERIDSSRSRCGKLRRSSAKLTRNV